MVKKIGIVGETKYERDWELVSALSCPYCGALVVVDEADEECWSCFKKSNLPDTY